jgi:hypothetical protein
MNETVPPALPPTAARCARALCQQCHRVLFEEDGLGTLFQHARNVLSSTMILAAGLYAVHHRPSAAPGLWATTHYAGHVVAAVGIALLLLNLWDGLRRLSRCGYPVLVHAFTTLLYLAMTVRLVQVVVYFRGGL